jgi:XTP/dITP diphosphohydrolase
VDKVKLLIATHNLGKLKEIQLALADLPIEVFSLSETSEPSYDVEEIGDTFHQVVERKAQQYARRHQALTLADDSGLMVKALDNLPGVHSKRFIQGSDHDRNLKILELLANKPDRSAEFVSMMCVFDPSTNEAHFFEGKVLGQIALEEKGKDGFGYDPIFIPEGQTQTFGELGITIKNQLSHRAKALQKVKEYFNKVLA